MYFLESLYCELSNAVSNCPATYYELPAWINAKSHAFVWPFTVVCVQMSPQIACMNPCWLHLICHHYVFSNVSSLWEYFDLQGPWQKVLTDLKKSLYTLQADPEKSRDFMIKNPWILINWKSRDPGIPGIPLGPGRVTHTDYHWCMYPWCMYPWCMYPWCMYFWWGLFGDAVSGKACSRS